jgi:hypothetical protein
MFILTSFTINYAINTKRQLNNNIKTLESKVATYKNKYGAEVAESRVLLRELNNAKRLADEYKLQVKDWKIRYANKVKIVTKVDTVYIKLDSLPCKDFTRSFLYSEPDTLLIKGVLSNSGIRFDKIELFTEYSTVTGKKNIGTWLRPQWEYRTEVTLTNPYMHVVDMQPMVIIVKKKWWENPWIIGPGAFVTGVIIGKL